MNHVNLMTLPILILSIAGCATMNDFSRFDLVEQERKGYSIILDSVPINLSLTYLNANNISQLTKNKKKRTVSITRKNPTSIFYSIDDLKHQNHYASKIDLIAVDGRVLDSQEVSNVRFESGSVQYIRLLTQEDYQGIEFDDLPQVRQSVGNGILVIITEEAASVQEL